MSMAHTGLSSDHRFMKAWNEFCATDEFKNALRWAVETKYDDGREISDIQREEHAKGAMWLALTRGMEVQAEELADTLAKLREALEALGGFGDGTFCFCDSVEQALEGHCKECLLAQKALAK